MQDIELRKPRKQLEFIWRGSQMYGPWGDIWTYAMETGALLSRTALAAAPALHPPPLTRCPCSRRWSRKEAKEACASAHNLYVNGQQRRPCGAGSYYHPEGFALGKLGEFQQHGEHMLDDTNSTEPVNMDQHVAGFVAEAQRMAMHIDGNDIMFTMGGGQVLEAWCAPKSLVRNMSIAWLQNSSR